MTPTQPLDQYLHAIVREHAVTIPADLVSNTGKILSRIFDAYPNPQVKYAIGLASIYAWCTDNIWDDPTLFAVEKHRQLDEHLRVLDRFGFEGEIPADDLPPLSFLLVEAFNALIRYGGLTRLDRFVLREQARRMLETVGYELAHDGDPPPIDELLFFSSYNYSTPFYGFMIYAADYHLRTAQEYARLDAFLYAFGLVGRLVNDVATYERERELGELNLVLVLEQQLGSLEAALKRTEALIAQAQANYDRLKALIPTPVYTHVIDRFLQTINGIYRVSDVRSLSTEELDAIWTDKPNA